MAKTYLIAVIALLGANNVMKHHGDVVTKADLTGSVEDLLENGFIVENIDKAEEVPDTTIVDVDSPQEEVTSINTGTDLEQEETISEVTGTDLEQEETTSEVTGTDLDNKEVAPENTVESAIDRLKKNNSKK